MGQRRASSAGNLFPMDDGASIGSRARIVPQSKGRASLTSPPPPCPECGERMRRLRGRAGRPLDETWMCQTAIAERRFGGKGPFTHEGVARIPMFIIRSPENQAAIEAEKQDFIVAYNQAVAKAPGAAGPLQIPKPGVWAEARPGDALVDRGLRTVYYVLPDGSRKRVDDPEAKAQAISQVKEQLERVVNNIEQVKRTQQESERRQQESERRQQESESRQQESERRQQAKEIAERADALAAQ